MCRCELLGGVLDSKAMTCTFKPSKIIYTNSSNSVFLAPIPCNESMKEEPFNCSHNKFPPILSKAIYAPMGVRSCEWFEIRDIITVVFWALSLICIASCLGRPDHPQASDPAGLACLGFLLFLACIALACVWEFVLGIFGFVLLSLCAVFIFRRFLSFPYEVMPVVS